MIIVGDISILIYTNKRMKFVVEADHHYYFENNQRIDFQDFISESQQNELLTRLQKHFDKKGRGLHGRNCWREDARVRGFVAGKSLAEVAGALLNSKRLLLAYDQFFPQAPVDLFSAPTTLDAISSIQGIVGGWLITLAGDAKGTATLLTPNAEIDFSALQYPLLLVVYATPDAVYVAREGSLKSADYSPGDNLFRKGHPLILS